MAFPEFPEVAAESASQLTEEEFKALLHYCIETEKIFDILAEREVFLDAWNNTNKE